MASFHINPTTGEPGKCRAILSPCPFGEDYPHFPSKEAARKEYERINASALLKTFSLAQEDDSIIPPVATPFLRTREELDETDELSFRDGRNDRFWTIEPKLPAAIRIAISAYKDEDTSKAMNGILRNDFKATQDAKNRGLFRDYVVHILNLEKFIAKATVAQHKPLYKGVNFESELEKQLLLGSLKALKPGSRITFPGFTSTSVSALSAQEFTGLRGGVVYEIVNAKGAYINGGWAEEVVIQKGSNFRFVEYENDDINNYVMIRLVQE